MKKPKFASSDSVPARMYRDRLKADVEASVLAEGGIYWGIGNEGKIDFDGAHYRKVRNNRGGAYSKLDFETEVNRRRRWVDRVAKRYREWKFNQLIEEFADKISGVCPGLHRDDLIARVNRAKFLMVDPRVLNGNHGDAIPRFAFARIAASPFSRFIDSTFHHEATHVSMGEYVVSSGRSFSFRQWLDDSDPISEGVACYVERFIMADGHDGTDPTPKKREYFEKLVEEFGFGVMIEALMLDLNPHDPLLEEVDAIEFADLVLSREGIDLSHCSYL